MTATPRIESFEPVTHADVLKRVADAEAAASLLPGLARPEDVERDGFVIGFRPDERLPVSQHAQRHRVLSGTATAEPGPWNNARTPYLVEPMDCLSTSSPVSEVALCFGAQLGKTELGLNFTSYVIDAAPGPMLLCQPTVEMGKRVSSQRIKPLIQESPRLRSKVRDSRSRDSGNTTLSKEFPGGILVITGANSGAGLRSMPVRFLFLDEVDAYPLTIPGEGSPIGLALARTRTFRNKRKILMTSTPVAESTSVIWRAYKNADMRRYFMPCPHCQEEITFEFERLRWEKGNPKSVYYKCPCCKGRIEEWQKTEMLTKGRWKATCPDVSKVDPTRRSYQLSSLYSPVGWLGWDEIAEKWESADGDIEASKEFRNTILALPWMEVGTRVDWEVLHGRRDVSGYNQGEVPDEALFLTAGADVGQDHVEVGIWGWGRNRQRFAIDHFRISGGYNEPSTWEQVSDAVLRTYKNRAGVADNADSISDFVGKVLREISGIAADLGNALIGESGKIERAWIGKLVPAIETARDVALDLLDVFTGGMPTRAPWLVQIGESLRDAGASALALADGIRDAAGFGDSKLPSLQEAATAVAEAFASMRAGITGQGDIKMPWAANIGETMKNVAAGIGIVAGVIVTHREEITSFAADATMLLSEGMAAIQSMLSGNQIAADNPFAFLNTWKAEAKAIYDGIVEDANWLKDQIVQAYETLEPMLETLWGWFDSIAKALGFNNGGELAIVIFVAHATGLLDIATNISTAFAGIALTVNNLVGTFGKLWRGGEKLVGLLGRFGKSNAFRILLKGLKLFGAALLAIPASAAAIGAAIAALVILAYIYWDEIKAAAAATWDWIVEKWEGFADWIGGVFDTAKKKAAEFWDWLKAAPGNAWDALVEKWGEFTDWVSGLFDAAKENLADFWDWMVGAPGRAWDSLTDIWGGFENFFSGLVDRVKGYFKGLWDGVKNGASDAWNSVKGWFGFGEGETADGTADHSPKLATGGIVHGPGGPMADKIRAWLSNGEGVLNARAVAHYGEGIVHALNNLMVPRTAFATGGIVGEMVPAMARPGEGLSDLHLSVFGQRAAGGLYADADGVRAIRRTFRNTARASRGPVPRWRGY